MANNICVNILSSFIFSDLTFLLHFHCILSSDLLSSMHLKPRCDDRFQHVFTAWGCVFKVITLVGTNQGNYFENATKGCKRTVKTRVATQLNGRALRTSGINLCLCSNVHQFSRDLNSIFLLLQLQYCYSFTYNFHLISRFFWNCFNFLLHCFVIFNVGHELRAKKLN